MITLTATNTLNFYEVLSSNLYDHHPLTVKKGNELECGCKGFTRHGHCYHVLEAATMVSYIPEREDANPIPVQGAEATEVTCSCCNAWMMKWAWAKHLAGGYCQTYLVEREAAAVAAPAPAVIWINPVTSFETVAAA